MNTDNILTKFATVLDSLSDNDLTSLKNLLYTTEGIDAFTAMVDSCLKFRQVHQKHQRFSNDYHRSISSQKDSPNKRRSNVSSDNAINKFTDILYDKSIFPSTIDVVDAVNKSFEWDIDYKEFRKRGRRDLIKKCVTLLNKLPSNTFKSSINNFYNEIYKKSGEVQKYKEFFNIIVGHE